MHKYAKTIDRIDIHYQITGTKPIAIVFVHGWLGNSEWWKNQQNYFKNKYTIVQIDLTGHGKSIHARRTFSSEQYAKDIKTVIDQIEPSKVVLVGHSMSGAYVLEASLVTPKVKAVILVDTLKNMDQLMNYEQANNFLFQHYKSDFSSAVKNLLPQFLFTRLTPKTIQEQLQNEFLKNEASFAVESIEPLYKMDIRKIAKLVQVPVRAINSDFTPTFLDNNLKYFNDYRYVNISGTGHYPMLEDPNEFNHALEKILQELSLQEKNNRTISENS